jgi:hypothetical protein
MQDRFQHLFAVISGQRFLNKQGLGNEVPFFICPFKPEMEVHFFHSGGHGFALRSKPSWTTYRWERLLATWLRYTGDKMNAVIDVSDDKADYSIVECPDEELPLE